MKRTRRGTFGSDAALSIGSAIVATVAALVTLPYIVNQLGVAAYGLFSLLALTTAYAGILDLGFSWTTSRFVADTLEREDDAGLRAVLRSSLTLYLVIGGLGAVVLALAARPLVTHVFNVPADAQDEGTTTARLFALGFPFAMLHVYTASVYRGVRRFDLLTATQVAATIGTSLALVTALALGAGLAGATAALVATQTAVAVAALIVAARVLPGTLSVGRIDTTTLRALARFSAAVSLANLGSQLLYLPNRLIVGMLLPLRAAGLFNVPAALAQRLQLVPGALVSAALPTMTAALARREGGQFWRTFWHLGGVMAATLLPPIVLGMVWAHTVLTIWVSDELKGEPEWVLRLFLLAVALNAAASVGAVALDSAGRPALPATATLVAGVVNVALAVAFTYAFGLVGAAAALAIALLIMLACVVALFARAPLPPVEWPWPRIGGARLAAAAVTTAVWVAVAIALRDVPASRVQLVILAALMLAAAYGVVAVAAGRRAVAARIFGRRPAAAP